MSFEATIESARPGGAYIAESKSTAAAAGGRPPPPPALATPNNVTEADAQLNFMIHDKAFGARLLSGDAAATAEWHAAHLAKENGDKVDQLLNGTTKPALFSMSTDGAMTIGDQLKQVEHFRNLGIPDEVIRQAFEGKPVSKAEYAAANLWRDQRMSDREWTARYLAGDKSAAREMMLANIIITNGPKED